MDVILSTLKGVSHQELGGFDVDIVAKSTCLTMLAGAVDTIIVTLTWALSLLLNNKNTLKMVQEELDLHVGKERQVEDSVQVEARWVRPYSEWLNAVASDFQS
ncbi:hypothetical protein LguiA_001747 [Lonicera macranthoides]